MIDATPCDVTPVDGTPTVVTPTLIYQLETVMQGMPGQIPAEDVTFHHFCRGLYAREYFMAAGTTAVGKRHKHESFFLLVRGIASFSTADGTVQRIEAPYLAITQPGSKRVVHAWTDSTFLTFHPNPDDVQDMAILESRYIIPEALGGPDRELIE